jgi:hypothetical protein
MKIETLLRRKDASLQDAKNILKDLRGANQELEASVDEKRNKKLSS